jgi:hypothetical protein
MNEISVSNFEDIFTDIFFKGKKCIFPLFLIEKLNKKEKTSF